MKKNLLLFWLSCLLATVQAQSYGWSQLGSGPNPLGVFPLGNNQISYLCSDNLGNIYATGAYVDSAYQYNILMWNGSAWSLVGGNTELPIGGQGPYAFGVDTSRNVYTGGYMTDTSGNYYVEVWNGQAWHKLNGFESTGPVQYFCPDIYGDMYIIAFDNVGGSQVYLCDGNSLHLIYTPGDFLLTGATDVAGNFYTGGWVTDGSGHEYVSMWDGSAWTELGSGVNGLNANNQIEAICTDPEGNVYAAGTFTNTNGRPYVAKWNGTNWSELVGTGNDSLKANGAVLQLCSDSAGNIYAAGDFTDTSHLAYVAKWNGTGWSAVGLSPYFTGFNMGIPAMCTDKHGNIYVGNVFPTQFHLEYVAKYGILPPGLNFITGTVFADTGSNMSCALDSANILLPGYVVEATSAQGNSYYGYSQSNGNYIVQLPDTGIYTIQALAPFNFYSNSLCAPFLPCDTSQTTIDINHMDDIANNVNWGFGGTNTFNLAMHPGWAPADPGFVKEYWVMPFNLSPVPLIGYATVIFTYDSNLIYQYSTYPLPIVDTIAHTLTWVVNGDSLPEGGFSFNERFPSYFMVPANLSLNYNLYSDFKIEPYAGDCDTTNNELQFSQTVTGSHDPNAKTVSPAGMISNNDSVLSYTIYFQNTGTDSTHFVVVSDTLSPNLEAASVRNLASSNNYTSFNISGKGILTWTFDTLSLPDSAVNPTGSQGFIIFSVLKKPNLAIGASISNTAEVYFDHNPAVTTNTVTDTISALTGITEPAPVDGISVKAFPNPFNELTHILVSGLNQKFDFELFDLTGRLLKRITGIQSNEFDVARSGLASGVYLYHITVNNVQLARGKLVME